jgi:hypothetical protein
MSRETMQVNLVLRIVGILFILGACRSMIMTAVRGEQYTRRVYVAEVHEPSEPEGSERSLPHATLPDP